MDTTEILIKIRKIVRSVDIESKKIQKEYGVSRDFIIEGIRAGKMEYRNGIIWGNPYLRVLRSQLEQYIVEELGAEHLSISTNRTELRKIKKEMANLKKRLDELQIRRTEIEKSIKE